MLLGCLLKMPYGYFQFVRLGAVIGFIWLAIGEFKVNKYFMQYASYYLTLYLKYTLQERFGIP